MPLGTRLAVNTHNMGGHFVESVKNAWRCMSPQEAKNELESIVEFQVQIKGHNQRDENGYQFNNIGFIDVDVKDVY